MDISTATTQLNHLRDARYYLDSVCNLNINNDCEGCPLNTGEGCLMWTLNEAIEKAETIEEEAEPVEDAKPPDETPDPLAAYLIGRSKS